MIMIMTVQDRHGTEQLAVISYIGSLMLEIRVSIIWIGDSTEEEY